MGPRLLAIEIFTALLYVVFNFGTRIFGMVDFLYRFARKRVSIIEVSITIAIIASSVLAFSLIQRGEWWNTIQFFYYAIFLSNIFIAQLVYNLLKSKRTVQIIVAIIILLATLPINIDFVVRYASFPPSVYVSREQLDALSFLKKQSDGTVLIPRTTKEISGRYTHPKPIWAADDTAYVAAYSGKLLYIADEHVLRILGIDYEARMKKVMGVWNCDLMKEVDYIYDIRGLPQMKDVAKCKDWIRELYKNEEVTIYGVRR
jgi:hypothetical protein